MYHKKSSSQRQVMTIAAIMLLLALLVSSCSSVMPTATVDLQATQNVISKQTADAALEQDHQTATAQQAATVQQAALDKKATSQAAMTQTEAARPTATNTPTPTRTPTPTKTPNLEATRAYEAMFTKVQQYAKDGYIPSTNGVYYTLPDFEDSLAKLNYYRMYPIGFSPNNFVVESDIDYASASGTANWFESGCGYVFHREDGDNHYAIFLTMDGYSSSNAFSAGYYYNMGEGYFGKMDVPKGKAHIALTVNGRDYAFFVNGKLAKKYQGFLGKLTKGDLGYTMISGTNAGYGTSCKFTNSELWVVND